MSEGWRRVGQIYPDLNFFVFFFPFYVRYIIFRYLTVLTLLSSGGKEGRNDAKPEPNRAVCIAVFFFSLPEKQTRFDL